MDMYLLLISKLFFFLFSANAPSQTQNPSIPVNYTKITYEEETKGKIIDTISWNISYEENGGLISLHKTGNYSTTTATYSHNMSLKEYAFTPKSSTKPRMQASCTDKQLHVTMAVPFKKSFEKKYSLQAPWIQIFEFGLIPFVQSANDSLRFTVLNPKDGTPNTMIATKTKIENISLDKKHFTAQKIIITLDHWLKKKFWSAELWFDTKTSIMLKYRANEGPGTPITTFYLKSFKN